MKLPEDMYNEEDLKAIKDDTTHLSFDYYFNSK